MRSTFDKLKKLRALPRSDRRLLMEAAGALPLIAASLRVLRINPLLDCLAKLAGYPDRPLSPTDALPTIHRTRRLVGLAAQHGLCGGNCLSRSTTLWWLLRRQGIPSELRIGVRKEGEKLHAHAWIEYEGVAVNDRLDTLGRYSPFDESLAR